MQDKARFSKGRIVLGLLLATMLFVISYTSFLLGYHEASGSFPFVGQVAVMPPVAVAQTFEDVSDFIVDDITSEYQYGEGMNCVDYALMMARNAQWRGLSAEVVKIDYEDGTAHAMIMFATEDQGIVFVEPQNDKVIDVLWPGQKYQGQTIVGVYVMGLKWVPLGQYLGGD